LGWWQDNARKAHVHIPHAQPGGPLGCFDGLTGVQQGTVEKVGRELCGKCVIQTTQVDAVCFVAVAKDEPPGLVIRG